VRPEAILENRITNWPINYFTYPTAFNSKKAIFKPPNL